MKLTALIPAHNDDYTLDLCLKAAADAFDEIFVLDDCSDDHTADVVLSHARALRMLFHSRQDPLRRYGGDPPLPAAIRTAPERFRIVYDGDRPADREDLGWTR